MFLGWALPSAGEWPTVCLGLQGRSLTAGDWVGVGGAWRRGLAYCVPRHVGSASTALSTVGARVTGTVYN